MTKEQCDKCIYKGESCYILALDLHSIGIGTLLKCDDYVWNGEL